MNIDNALSELLYPFRRYWIPTYCVIHNDVVGFEQCVSYCTFYGVDGNELDIPESDEIQKIVDLWDEECFYDLIHNQFISHIFQNMVRLDVNDLKIIL